MATKLAQAGGWLGFDRFMELALYAPGLGYYTHGSTQFGRLPQGLRQADGSVAGAGSDFVTAPEMTPLFGRALANHSPVPNEQAQPQRDGNHATPAIATTATTTDTTTA